MIVEDIIRSLGSDAPVQNVTIGPFWTCVTSRSCGLASTVKNPNCHHGEPQVRDVGKLTEKNALELAQLALSEKTLEASIGMAAINSLMEVDVSKCTEINAGQILQKRGKGKKVVIVGHFPFVNKVREVAAKLSVLELRPDGDDLPADYAESVIPEADIVAITGYSFINHTFEGLFSLCRPESLVMVLGPTTPLTPLLFDYGVDILSGTVVVDGEVATRCAAQGAIFPQVGGVRLLSMVRDGAV